jgi:AraC family transcriptional regulator
VTKPDRLRRILELIEASLDEADVAGEDLARRAHLSRFHFQRLVHAALGEPPGAFRRRLLLERSAYRLTATGDRVIEIALEAGYAAPEAFARAFSRAFGCSPTEFRSLRTAGHELAAANGIHFYPPGGIRIPATERSTAMDIVIAMLDHHLSLVAEIFERLERVDGEVLDRPIQQSIEGIDGEPTLRSVCDRLVGQLEMWNTALQGEREVDRSGERTPAALLARLEDAAPRFRELLVAPIREGRAGETFLDATCTPPQTFSFGGVLAHVLTFAAVRRTMAIGALETAGVADLGAGDPMSFVGGCGDDASTIRRRWR